MSYDPIGTGEVKALEIEPIECNRCAGEGWLWCNDEKKDVFCKHCKGDGVVEMVTTNND